MHLTEIRPRDHIFQQGTIRNLSRWGKNLHCTLLKNSPSFDTEYKQLRQQVKSALADIARTALLHHDRRRKYPSCMEKTFLSTAPSLEVNTLKYCLPEPPARQTRQLHGILLRRQTSYISFLSTRRFVCQCAHTLLSNWHLCFHLECSEHQSLAHFRRRNLY